MGASDKLFVGGVIGFTDIVFGSVASNLTKIIQLALNSGQFLGLANTKIIKEYKTIIVNILYNNHKLNKELYFNPVESLGIGTTAGPGISTTLIFSNPGVGATQISIPTKSIYIPNHKLESGDELIYSFNGGSSISVSDNGITPYSLSNNSIVYATKLTSDLIGISTYPVGLGTTGSYVGIGSTASLLYFTGVGSGQNHSFRTNYKNEKTSFNYCRRC